MQLNRSPKTKTNLTDALQHYVAQNSNFSETGSYFMEKISSGFPSKVLRLLSLNSVIHGGSWKQHAGHLQIEASAAAAAAARVCVLSRYQRRFGLLPDRGPVPEWTPEPEPSEWAM